MVVDSNFGKKDWVALAASLVGATVVTAGLPSVMRVEGSPFAYHVGLHSTASASGTSVSVMAVTPLVD